MLQCLLGFVIKVFVIKKFKTRDSDTVQPRVQNSDCLVFFISSLSLLFSYKQIILNSEYVIIIYIDDMK